MNNLIIPAGILVVVTSLFLLAKQNKTQTINYELERQDLYNNSPNNNR